MMHQLLFFLEGNMSGLGGLVFMFFLIGFSPAIIALIAGLAIKENNPKVSKYLFIFVGVYLIIGLGICGSMMS